jgi:hypothetical protein
MQAFTPDDLALATELYAASDGANERALLNWFIDHPDEVREGFQLARDLGFPETRAVARSTYTIGLVAAGLDRSRPWHEAQRGYSMSAAQAELFAKARAAAGA